MIVYLNKEGRFGHQLSHFITLMAYAIKYNSQFYYHSCYSNYHQYLNIQPKYFKTLNKPNLFFIRLIYYFLKLLRIDNFKIGNYKFILCHQKQNEILFSSGLKNLFEDKSKYVITDFMLNDIHAIVEYIDELHKNIQINTNNSTEIDKLINDIRKNYPCIISIHIRKTDFKEFANGKYYYDELKYKQTLKQLITILNKNTNKTAVIICSDESINTTIFKEFNTFYSNRKMIDDFMLLMNADYIISSRSIFSFCASLFGKNKIIQISSKQFEVNEAAILSSIELMKREYDLEIKPENII